MKYLFCGIFVIAGAVSAFANESSDSVSSQYLNELVVTGSNNAVGRNLLPYTVSVVDCSQLEATGNTQLLSALSGMVPSLFVTERNIFGFGVSTGGSGHIKLRGVGGDRASGVLMMVDGQPQFAGLYSHHVADFYSTDYVDRVEVLRGPASVLYGSNAMAGVINVITKNPDKAGVRTTLTSQYGSYNTWLTSLSNTVKCGRFTSLLSAGYDRTDGVTKNFDFSDVNVYAKVGYEFSSHWRVLADYSLMAFTGNDPVYPALKGQNDVIYHQRVIRGEASATSMNTYNRTNGALRVYYSYGNHFIHDPNYFHSLDDRFGVIAYQNFMPWKDAVATVGFDFDRYSGEIPVSGGKDHLQNPMATMARQQITEYSPYITIQQNMWRDRISLNAGLRIANSNLFDTEWVPQIGFMISPWDGWRMKGSLAKGYRNPSFRELYLYKFANPDLQPESMMNYEVTVGKSFSRYFNMDITGYLVRGKNLIQQTAELNENTGEFINKGIEVTAMSKPLDCLTFRASYSFLHTSLANLTGAPRQQYYLGASWHAFRGFQADIEMKGVGGLYIANDVPTQNYVTLNLHISYQLIRQLQLFFNADNVTDSRYVINKGYPMPGFTILGGFRLTL